MRRGTLLRCAATTSNGGSSTVVSSRSTQPSTTPVVVANPVVRSLYRALLREAKVLDSNPLLKTLFPLSQTIQNFVHADALLYTPGGQEYVSLVRNVFRSSSSRPDGPTITGAFEALQRMQYHNREVVERLKESTKEREALMTAIKSSAPTDGTYYARALAVRPNAPTSSQASPVVHKKKAAAVEGDVPPPSVPPTTAEETNAAEVTSSPETTSNKPPRYVAVDRSVVPTKIFPSLSKPTASSKGHSLTRHSLDLKPGVALVAHPLSSAHGDRRVLMIVSKTPHTTTAVVLDMQYSYPLSAGNPMFPEVFWGHEVYNGGYLHVDFTMPPTACVSVLHTLPPPAKQPDVKEHAAHSAWMKWLRTHGGRVGAPTQLNTVQHHELLCKPLIRGSIRPDGSQEPTLYYSSIEALPYLSALAAGQPRSRVRIYWGCMRWPTHQIQQEVLHGHWIPVELSPTFFASYPVLPQKKKKEETTSTAADEAPAASPTAAASPSPSPSPILSMLREDDLATHASLVFDERFPTAEELQAAKEHRIKYHSVDVVAPQVFPPHQPVCRREVLWDQIMHSLGGEYESLVGCVNPFAVKQREGPRSPPAQIVGDEDDDKGGWQATPIMLGLDDDDDDE